MKTGPLILVIYGGGGTEHDVSIVSAGYIVKTLKENAKMRVLEVLIEKNGEWHLQTENGPQACFLKAGGLLVIRLEDGERLENVDLAIPCIHGPPGETGDIQSYLEFYNIPYVGASPEASRLCFNKVSTKLWLNALRVPNTPFIFLDECNEINIKVAEDFFDKQGDIFVKASSQGSSVGCYPVNQKSKIKSTLQEAFKFSPYILIEKKLEGRELEISVFEYQGKVHTSYPGEIICPSKFYSYEEKYSPNSSTTTVLRAENLPDDVVKAMQQMALKAFTGMKIRHLARVDFFLTKKGDIYLNEINTFPGMTPISMFPKMMEASGVTFLEYMKDTIENILKNKSQHTERRSHS